MKVLIANRGEIAIRIIRTCREMGFSSVAVYSDTDQDALHTRYADEAVYLGPTSTTESYGCISALLQAARQVKAQAIHPGYGFLSENARFARAVEDEGLIFIGPTPETIALTGDKLEARKIAREVGLPVLAGPDQPLPDMIPIDYANEIIFPVLIKAVAGGGGRGIRLAHTSEDLEIMVSTARSEARTAFGDETVYLEQLVQQARHVEVQILGDGQGNILCLGERECSIQRRRQKLIEESPAPGLNNSLRYRLYEAAIQLAKRLNYRSLGTIEFLLDEQGKFYFIEVNPRIQVEHPITEMVTGIDLVGTQLQLVENGSVRYKQDLIRMNGSAIEARVLAEDPEQGFMPTTGEITHLMEPGGPGIRVDSALYLGMPVTVDYDSMIAKVISWGENRSTAIRRLRCALGEFQIGGVSTDIKFLCQILDSNSFIAGRADTTYLDYFHPVPSPDREEKEREAALAAAILADKVNRNSSTTVLSPGGLWRMVAWREQMRG